MKNTHHIEKLTRAVHSMAVSPKSIQDRLADVYVDSLIYIKPDDMPQDLRYRFTELSRKLTAVDSPEGSVIATTRQMSEMEAIELAQEIFALFDSVTHLD
jgi:enoyl-[acyl-carrier-protein] reductase (NADH)